MLSKKSFLLVSLIILVASICGPAMAATQTQINEAIENGVAWLAAQQNSSTGYWQDGSQLAGPTGFALAKLQERAYELGYTPFDPCYPYKQNVEKGLAYLFSQMSIISISNQLHGNPDTDGDGIGVCVHSSTYETGIAMMAIAASRVPGRVVNSPSSPVNGWTYKKVLQEMADYMAFGQCDSGSGRGGWGYSHNSGSPDNSNSGYAVSGLGYAESCVYGFKCTVPQFVKDELKFWIDYIQTDGGDNDGGSGYNSPDYLVNILKTGNLIFQMTFVGRSFDDPNVQRALNYLGRTWNAPNRDPGWGNPAYYGGSPHFQAMYCATNGMGYSGINMIVVNGSPRDWYADFADAIVNCQQTSGNWPADLYGGIVLATEWALLTLEKPSSYLLRVILTKTNDVNDGDCVGPGREITYTIDYNYPARPNCPDINDVNIIDELPDELEPNNPSDPNYNPGDHTYTWNIGTLHPGDKGFVTLKVVVKPCVEPNSTIINECEIKSGDVIYNTACENTSVCVPTLTKVDNVPDGNCVDPNNNIIYSICYAANGYGDTNVVIDDNLPDEVEFVSATGDYEYIAGTVTWNIGTLGPNESGCVTLTVKVKQPLIELCSAITNCSQMTGNGININACESTNVCSALSACCNAKRDAEAADGYWDRLPGDLNDDCYVNITDLGLWVQDWLKDYWLGMTQTGWNATNLLLNPSFEDAKASNPNEPNEWTFANNQGAVPPNSDVNYWHDGGRTGDDYIETWAESTDTGGAWAVAYQTHYIAEDRSYKLEAYAKDNGGTRKLAELKLEYKDSSGNIIMTTAKSDFAINANWTLLTLSDPNVAPMGARRVSAVVGTGGLEPMSGNTYICWDDVKLTMNGAPPTNCEQAQFDPEFSFSAADFNRDCAIDFTDYAIFTGYWLECNAYPYILTCHYLDAKHK